MNLLDTFRGAIANLMGHPLRTGLTMLGIVFGVGAVIAMLSIGEGAERQAMEMIERLGARNLILRDVDKRDDELEEARIISPGVSPRDAEAAMDAVPGIEQACLRTEIDPYTVLADGITVEATAQGVSASYASLTSLRLAEGRFIDTRDELSHAQVCVIGQAVRRELFGIDPVLGRALKVNDLWLEVIGVIGGSGGSTSIQGVAVDSADRAIYLPVTTVLRKLDRPPLEAPLDEIVLRLDADADPRATATMLGELIDRLHGGIDDYELVVPEVLLEQSRRTQRLFSIVMGAIAGISLLVGGIGIANIMLATVFERTREIGIRRAVGATRHDIRRLFLIESYTISVLGGMAGIVVGIAIAKLVAASAGWPTVVTLWSVLLSSGVAIAVGLASGLYPALRAADLNPIDALRHE